MTSIHLNKIYNQSLIVGFFSFLFLWDIKTFSLEPRYFFILPFFSLILLKEKFILNLKKNYIICVFPIFIIFHFILTSFFLEYNLDLRDYFGLIFLILISIILTENIDKIYLYLKNFIDIFIIFFSFSFLIFFYYSKSTFKFDCYDGWFHNNKFFFLENSHFSIICVPIIIYYLLKFSQIIKFKNKDYFIFIFFIIFLLISFLNFSTTFLYGIILSSIFISIKHFKNLKIQLASLLLIFLSALILTNYKQCVNRSYGSFANIKNYYKIQTKDSVDEKIIKKLENSNFNMSIETFLVSLEITKKSFFQKPFGVGFNKYYLSHQEFINDVKLIDPDIKKNNVYDGTNNFSKLLTEFGIFGIIIMLILPIFYFKKTNIKNIEYFLLVLVCIQFIRGVGYFNGGMILAYLIIIRQTFDMFLKKNNNYFLNYKIHLDLSSIILSKYLSTTNN